MFKKAQGMSVNVIIIAIIVLAVLIVLIMIFTGYIGGWAKSVSTCQTKGGTCTDETQCVSMVADPADATATRYPAASGQCFDSNGNPDTNNPNCCSAGTKPDTVA
ncbi:MAG: hypothetical protein V1702_03125 [Candidatus Woesearchaeota archaeon]